MMPKSTVRLSLVLLFVALIATPSSGFAVPVRGDSVIEDLFDAARQWALRIWTWQPLETKHGCGIDPWGQPKPCPPATTKHGCGIDPIGRPIPCS
jgi:hypothetical protein